MPITKHLSAVDIVTRVHPSLNNAYITGRIQAMALTKNIFEYIYAT